MVVEVTKPTESLIDECIPGKSDQEPKWLPKDFQPLEGSVICGKGREGYLHPGNQRFRKLCEENLEQYLNAKTKLDKKTIIQSIIDAVRDATPTGSFVRQELRSKRWIEVDNAVIRQKILNHLRASNVKNDPVKRRARQERQKPKARRTRVVPSLRRASLLGPRHKHSEVNPDSTVAATSSSSLMSSSLDLEPNKLCLPPTLAKEQEETLMSPPRNLQNSTISVSPQSNTGVQQDCWSPLTFKQRGSAFEARSEIFLQPPTFLSGAGQHPFVTQTVFDPRTVANMQPDTVPFPQKTYGLNLTSMLEPRDETDYNWNYLQNNAQIFDNGFNPMPSFRME